MMFLGFLENDTALRVTGCAKTLSHHDAAFWKRASTKEMKKVVLKMP